MKNIAIQANIMNHLNDAVLAAATKQADVKQEPMIRVSGDVGV